MLYFILLVSKYKHQEHEDQEEDGKRGNLQTKISKKYIFLNYFFLKISIK